MNSTNYATYLETFVEVVRQGSFSGAARHMGVAISSITRKIDALEADLQTELFVRSTRNLRMTDAGEELFSRAHTLIKQLIDTRIKISTFDEKPTGVLRISCLPTFGRLHVIPVIQRILDRWPNLAIEMDLRETLRNPATGLCDAAIRIGTQPDSDLIATQIGLQHWVICASPSYLQTHGYPADIPDIQHHQLIGKVSETAGISWKRSTQLRHIKPVFQCDEFEAQRLAAISGIGLVMLPNWVVHSDIVAGKLIHLFDEPDAIPEPVQILRSQSRAPPKLRIFITEMQRSFL